MRLELVIIEINDVQFADQTRVTNGVLTINRDELRGILEEDKCFDRVDIELAHPGENCRIIQVTDVIEPRAKIGDGNDDLKDAMGDMLTAGEGKTCVLRGATVVLSDDGPSDRIIDMSGPSSEAGPFGRTRNVVLLAKPKDGVSIPDYQASLKKAGLKAAAYLARAGADLEPDDIEVYEMPSLTEISKGCDGLPRVTYIMQIVSLQFEPVPGEPILFGGQAGGMVPAVIHPNQVLDGAVTSAFPALNVDTYHIQNHSIIKELYGKHGKDLCFCGVIVTIAANNVRDIDRLAKIASGTAKWVVGADGAVLTKTGGGAPELTLARTAQMCEQLGVKTAIAMLHMGADIKDAKYGATTIFNMPEVDAIVSMGVPAIKVTLPPVERIIGNPDTRSEGPPVSGEIVRELDRVKGAFCQHGSAKWRAVRY
ncbi:MAG: beta-aspartyl-peptidase [Deltaproteobacteria bacterium]|nr:beta-aspartyl-peptidase [Deltaproteobacteria bacterium]